MNLSDEMVQILQAEKDPLRAVGTAKFFQAQPGGYGEGDQFWGIKVPIQRKISRIWCAQLSADELASLLSHPVHEVRLTALMALVLLFQRAGAKDQKALIVELYLANSAGVNNWDLVDSSAHQILGEWLCDKDWSLLTELAVSPELWKQRIAMIASYAFVKKGAFGPTLALARLLIDHRHDLIHKAVGWMLREVGNRDQQVELSFLKDHYHFMPRTMLRYAIEKFPEALRQDFLTGRA